MGHDKFSDFKINIPKDEEYLGIDDIANVEPILKKLPELFTEYEKNKILEYKKKHENNDNTDWEIHNIELINLISLYISIHTCGCFIYVYPENYSEIYS